MKHIFYFFAIVAIFWEMHTLFSLRDTHNFLLDLRDKGKNKTSDTEYTTSETTFGCYIAWCLTGLFSSQWLFFLFILLISFIPKKLIALRFFDAVATTVALILLILNAYHFKVDNLELLMRIIH